MQVPLRQWPCAGLATGFRWVVVCFCGRGQQKRLGDMEGEFPCLRPRRQTLLRPLPAAPMPLLWRGPWLQEFRSPLHLERMWLPELSWTAWR